MTPSVEIDYLIVGQGLAGTLLCHELLKANQSVRVIDNHHQGSSTAIAAGLINPITGYRFVKSWLLDDLLPLARQTYAELEDLLGHAFYQDREILRALFSPGEENDWLARTAREGWSKYVNNTDDWGLYQQIAQPAFSQGILYGAQVEVATLISAYRDYLRSTNRLWEAQFDHQLVDIQGQKLRYDNFSFGQIVFCEGHRGSQNPWFSYLPF